MFEWKATYSVNVQEIDKQHQKLVKMVNDLDVAMSQGKGKEALGKVLNELVQYTVTHFAFEEKLMAQHGYPDLAKHQAEHDALKKKAGEIAQQFQSSKMGLTIPTMEFLKSWLTTHIQGTDKQYTPFFNSKGVK